MPSLETTTVAVSAGSREARAMGIQTEQYEQVGMEAGTALSTNEEKQVLLGH